MNVKFPIGSSVVVECESRSNYEGIVLESLPTDNGIYYKIESDESNGGTLWVIERRLMLVPILDNGMESWDMC